MDTVTRKSFWGKAQTMLRAQHDCPHGPKAAPVIHDSPDPEKGRFHSKGRLLALDTWGKKRASAISYLRRRVEAPVPEACIVLCLPSRVPLW